MNNQYQDTMIQFPTFIETEPKYVGQDKNYGSKPMLFKEVVEGDHFMYAGEMLTKTGLRTAQSFRKRNIQQFIFNPGDLVHKTFIASDSIESDDHPVLHNNESDKITETSVYPFDIRCHNPLAEFEKPQCEITIHSDTRNVEVWEDEDYRWETTIAGDLNKPWSVPICLKNINLTLMYSGNKIMLGFIDEKSIHSDIAIIWERPFDGWDGVSSLIISIKDIRLNFEEFNDF